MTFKCKNYLPMNLQVANTIFIQLKNQNDELAKVNAALMEEVKRMKKQIEDLSLQGELYYLLFKQETSAKEAMQEEIASLKRKIEDAPKRQRGDGVALHLKVSKQCVLPFYERLASQVRWSWGCVSQTRFMIVEVLKKFLPIEFREGLLYVGWVEQWQELNEDTMMIAFKVSKEAETEFVEWVEKNLFK